MCCKFKSDKWFWRYELKRKIPYLGIALKGVHGSTSRKRAAHPLDRYFLWVEFGNAAMYSLGGDPLHRVCLEEEE